MAAKVYDFHAVGYIYPHYPTHESAPEPSIKTRTIIFCNNLRNAVDIGQHIKFQYLLFILIHLTMSVVVVVVVESIYYSAPGEK